MTAGITIPRAQTGDEAALALIGQATLLDAFAGVLDGAAVVEHCREAHAPARYAGWLQDPRSLGSPKSCPAKRP